MKNSEYCQSFTFIKNYMMPLQSNVIQANKSECKVEFKCIDSSLLLGRKGYSRTLIKNEKFKVYVAKSTNAT